MSARDYLTEAANISTTARVLDFVTRFGRNWEGLLNVMGCTRPIRKVPGAVLKSKEGSITLQSGAVTEGDTIPYSEAFVTETTYAEMDIEKYAKAVSIEAIKQHGYDVAIAKTDEAFLNQLQNAVMTKFYNYIKTGSMTYVASTFQDGLAMAKGLVQNEFKKMNRDCSEVIAFANLVDVYKYIGAASITVQHEFGFDFVRDFMGYRVVFLCGDNLVARNQIIALPIENVVNYYIDPSDSDFARAGLEYTTDGVTNLIGFHVQGNYGTAVSESYAILGLILFAEYLNGIAVVTVDAGTTAGSLTLTSTAGTAAAGDSKLTITETPVGGGKFYYKAQASTAPTSPAYLASLPTGYTQFTSGAVVSGLTNGHKIRIIEMNGAGQMVATCDGTVVAKT